jgi:predicted anti-sigma-YlaC factor YlaD
MADVEHLTCEQFVAILTEYLEGCSDPELRADIERHIVICAGCANYVEQFNSTIDLLGRLSDEEPGDVSTDGLLEVFHAWRDEREGLA